MSEKNLERICLTTTNKAPCMRTKLLNCLLILFWYSLSACTTMQPMNAKNANSHDTPQAVVNELWVGDRVSITTIDGASYNLTIVEIDVEILSGVSCESCSPIAIEVASIERLSTEKISVVKSAGASVGIILGAVLLVALIAGPGFSPGQ